MLMFLDVIVVWNNVQIGFGVGWIVVRLDVDVERRMVFGFEERREQMMK